MGETGDRRGRVCERVDLEDVEVGERDAERGAPVAANAIEPGTGGRIVARDQTHLRLRDALDIGVG